MEAMENIRIVLAGNIRAIRKKTKMSQDILADRSGLSIGMIKNVELGKRWPSPATTEAIAKGLGVTISELFAGKIESNVVSISVSSVLKKMMAIPDDVYDLAEKYTPDHPVWKTVRAAFEIEEMDLESKKPKSKKA